MLSAIVLGVCPAAADDSRLEVRGADRCVRRSNLEPRIVRWLGAPAWDADTRVLLDLSAVPVRFEIVRARRSVAERSFATLPARCSQRLDALALAMALAIEQSSAADGGMRTPSETAPPPGALAQSSAADGGTRTPSGRALPPGALEPPRQATAVATPVAPASAPEARARTLASEPAQPRERSGLRLALGAGAVVHAPLAAAAMASGGLEWSTGALSLEAALAASLPGVVRLGEGRVRTQDVALLVRLCGQLRVSLGALFACAGGLGAAVIASGQGFARNHTLALQWLAVSARSGLRWPASRRVSVRLSADLMLDLLAPELLAGPPGTASAALGPFAAAGVLELIYELP